MSPALALAALLWSMVPPVPTRAGESSSSLSCPTRLLCYVLTAYSVEKWATTDPGGGFPYEDGGEGSFVCPVLPRCIRAYQGVLSVSEYAITPDASPPATWLALSGSALQLLAPSCPTALVCLVATAAGGLVLRTSDGGRTWQESALPAMPGPPDLWRRPAQTACASALDCYLLDETIGASTLLATHDGGATWHVLPRLLAMLGPLTCPAALVCYAVDQYGTVRGTRDGGATWRSLTPALPNYVFPPRPERLSCPDANTCYGYLLNKHDFYVVTSTTDGGRTWHTVLDHHKPMMPPGGGPVPPPGSVSCPAPSVCSVLEDSGRSGLFTTTDGGHAWGFVASALPGGAALNGRALHCLSVTVCFLSSDTSPQLARSMDGGHTWQVLLARTQTLDRFGPSCPSPTFCLYADSGGRLVGTADGGASWRQLYQTQETVQVQSLACVSSARCLAAGERGALQTSDDAGQTWTIRPSPTSSDLQQVACADARDCYAAGKGGAFVASADAGSSWRLGASAPLDAAVALSCPVAGHCLVASGTAIARTIDGGQSWAVTRRTTEAFAALACPTALRCYALEQDGTQVDYDEVSVLLRSADGGATWQRGGSTPDPSQNTLEVLLVDLACPDAVTCFAAGETDGGQYDKFPSGVLYATADGGASLTQLSD